MGAVGAPGHLDEELLVGPESVFAAEDRRLDGHPGGGGIGTLLPIVEPEFLAPRETFDLGDNGPGKGFGEGMAPEALELRLHPVAGLRGIVFPYELVVECPSRIGLVGATQEAGTPSIGVADDARLAMDHPEGFVGQDPDLELGAAFSSQEAAEALQAIGASADEGFGVVLEEGQFLCLLRRGDIRGLDVRVADHPDGALDALQGFASELEEGGVEVARDAVVGGRPGQPFDEKAPPRL
jgi:hypothetical protein